MKHYLLSYSKKRQYVLMLGDMVIGIDLDPAKCDLAGQFVAETVDLLCRKRGLP